VISAAESSSSGSRGQGKDGQEATALSSPTGQATSRFFSTSFAKSDRENIEDDELQALRDIAAAWLRATGGDLDNQTMKGLAQEVQYDEGEQDDKP
jgi:hypothetical protein